MASNVDNREDIINRARGSFIASLIGDAAGSVM
jgi:hypothetical protein